jgi:long-chain acyl-CoA synthetase
VNEQPSLCAAFQASVQAQPDAPALRVTGGGEPVTWRQYGERVQSLAGGLWALGVRPGDTVAFVMSNVPEFHLLDVAVLHLRAIPFSIHTGESAERVEAQIERAGARVAVLDAAVVERFADGAHRAGVERLVLVGGPAEGDAQTAFDTLKALPHDGFDFEGTWRAATRETIALVVFTSGTTGVPKGVQLTHGNLLFAAANLHTVAPVGAPARTLSYLPNSHLAERFMSHYMGIAFGYEITCVPAFERLFEDIRDSRPTRFFGVPRIFERLEADARAVIAADPALRDAHERALSQVRRGDDPSDDDLATLAPVRGRLGLDQAEWIGVAAAPSSAEILASFLAMGLPVADLWGLTECLMTTMNPPGRIRLGTVGPPSPGVEVRIADDGEILVRGGNVFAGYRGDPERTREMLDEDGWVHTGDLGRLDEAGYLTIAGRAKEMIINASGHNISPVTVEHTVKGQSPLIEHVAAIGDGRRYLVALVTLEPAELKARGLEGDYAELARSEAVQHEVARAVAAANERLPRVEQIRAFTVLPARWSTDHELTSLLKLKRSVIATRYADEIEALYG